MLSRLSLVTLGALSLGAVSLEAAAQPAGTGGYAVSGAGAGVVRAGNAGVCLRTGYWTPALANVECDPDLVPRPAAAAAPAPTPTPPAAVAPAPKPAPAPVAPVAPKKPAVVNLKGDSHFEFNKSTLSSAGKAEIDKEVVSRLKDMGEIRYINVNGHTDRLGSAQYNQKLSEARAESVKAYLISRGADPAKIETYGYGKTMPIKSCPDKVGGKADRKALIECLAPNRRVEVEIQGTPR